MTAVLQWWHSQSPKPSFSCSSMCDLWLREAPTASLACSRYPGREEIAPVRSSEMSLLQRGCTCRGSRCLLFPSRAFKAINQFISLGHWLSTEVCFACRGFSCVVQSSGDIPLSSPGAVQEEGEQEYLGAHTAKLKLSGVSQGDFPWLQFSPNKCSPLGCAVGVLLLEQL